MRVSELFGKAGIDYPQSAENIEISEIVTDSRRVCEGCAFICINGLSHDGHEYIGEAISHGARVIVVEQVHDAGVGGAATIIVENTRRAAALLYNVWHGSPAEGMTLVAVTGTNGKTTTKELIREVLSVKYCVTATEGNLNNSIGVPLTLLKVNSQTQLAVVEMGASHPGDIKELVNIALPNFGLITNVGKAHLLGFGSFEGVMQTKGELYDYLRRTADKTFLNVDNPYLCRMASEREMHQDSERPDQSLVIPYGLEYSSAKVLPSTSEYPFLRIELPSGRVVSTNLVGSYNADNVMAAIAVGNHFGVTLEEAVAAIEAYVPSNNRSQMTRTERNTLIVDAYNANPTSMEAALKNFANVESDNKVAMLGDMLELGTDSVVEHIQVLRKALESGIDLLCLVGEEFAKAVESENACDKVKCFGTSQELAEWITAYPMTDTVVLIKGSRGTRMEKVITVL